MHRDSSSRVCRRWARSAEAVAVVSGLIGIQLLPRTLRYLVARGEFLLENLLRKTLALADSLHLESDRVH